MTEKSKNSASASVKFEPKSSEPWVDPDDGPEWTDEMWDRAEIRHGDKVIRPGNPPLDDLLKGVVSLRLDGDVLAAYLALGADWQTQVNADLRHARKLASKVKKAV